MKKGVFFTTIFLIFLSCLVNMGHAFELDETVDDEIRKNYNPSKLTEDTAIESASKKKTKQVRPEEELPELPSISKQEKSANSASNPAVTKTSSSSSTSNIPPKSIPISTKYVGGNTKIRKGTSFEVVNNSNISDYMSQGTSISFKTQKQISGKGYTFPAGTIFYGEILESHKPQISCNGGLVVVRVYSVVYRGQTIPLKGYITLANGKKIFLNNIKGKRTYLKTMYQKGNWGRTIFNKMLSLTINLGGSGSTVLLSPFPLAYGTICLGANTLLSPITAFFSKGGHVSIPAGSRFKIKLLEDIYI